MQHGQAKQDFDYFHPGRRITFQPDPGGMDDPTGAYVGMPSLASQVQPQLIMPGYPDSSFILGRMKHRRDEFISMSDNEQMPPLATSQPDSAAVGLIEQWVCALRPGTPCRKSPWLPDATFWDTATASVSMRPRVRMTEAAWRPRIIQGMLSLPNRLAADRVELRDYRGRRVPMVAAGRGRYRLPVPLAPGVYLLQAGRESVYLNHLP